MKREALEETCLQIEPLGIFQVYDSIVRGDGAHLRFHYLVHYVGARPVSGDLRAGDDALQARWLTADEIASLPMHPINQDIALRLLRESPRNPPTTGASTGGD